MRKTKVLTFTLSAENREEMLDLLNTVGNVICDFDDVSFELSEVYGNYPYYADFIVVKENKGIQWNDIKAAILSVTDTSFKFSNLEL